jgi:hypothetical protein
MNPTEPTGETSAQPPATGPKIAWSVFLVVLLAPTLLIIASVQLGANEGGTAPTVAMLGGGISGIVCGTMLGRRFGRTSGLKVVLGIIFSVVLGAACIAMNCFGCLASGYNPRF